MPNPTSRHCTECNAEIYESMGACNSADVLAVMLGQQNFVRERCGLCALRPYVAEKQVFDLYRLADTRRELLVTLLDARTRKMTTSPRPGFYYWFRTDEKSEWKPAWVQESPMFVELVAGPYRGGPMLPLSQLGNRGQWDGPIPPPAEAEKEDSK